MQNNKSTFRLIASITFLIVAVLAIYIKTFRALAQFSLDFWGGIWGIQILSADLLIFPAALVLGIIGLLKGRDNFLLWGSIVLWVYCVPMVWLSIISFQGIEVLFSAPISVLLGYEFTDQAITLGLTAATAFMVLSTMQKDAQAPEVQVVPTEPNQPAESPMPILTLVGAFVFPVIGIILGHLSLSQMRSGVISSRNRGLAQAGLFISYLITGIAVLSVLWFLWVLSNWQAY